MRVVGCCWFKAQGETIPRFVRFELDEDLTSTLVVRLAIMFFFVSEGDDKVMDGMKKEAG